MSYVGDPFKHDLFVSYSHGSDESGNSYLQEWSEAFAHELELELRSDLKVRATLDVFLDKNHRPGQGVNPLKALTEQLQLEVAGSGVLVVLMSPDYLNSRWCKDEREWWCAKQGEAGISPNGRIAVVRIWPTPGQSWPAAFLDSRGQELPGFPFFVPDPTAPRPLGWTEKSGTGYAFTNAFRKALLEVAASLYPQLDALKSQVEAIQRALAEENKLAQPGGQMIYLHGRRDHAQTWEKAWTHLTNSGFEVLPGEPDPVAGGPLGLRDISERRIDVMSNCDALLLLGTEDGFALDADLVVVGKHDRQSARARSRRLLPCGVLDVAGRALATPMRLATARNVQADWLDGTHEPWAPRVQQWLAQTAQQAAPTT